MRSTFLGLETATRGLMSSQKALDIVGNNVANIGVTGYTRQRVDLVSVSVNGASSRYAASRVANTGLGVGMSGVAQIRDSFLDKRFRDEYCEVGYYDNKSAILSEIETTLDEIEPSTLTNAFTTLENAWAAMQTDNGQRETSASGILSASRTLTQVFTQMSTKMNNLWQQEKTALSNSVGTVNSILEQIATLNKEISDQVTTVYGGSSTYGPNELMDSRNVLIDELSKYADISVAQETNGSVTITMGADNHVAVKGDEYDGLTLSRGGKEMTVEVAWKSTGEENGFTSGSILAATQMLNGRGANADLEGGERLDNGLLYYMEKIDTFASVIAKSFNSVIPVVDANGALTGKYKQLFSFGGDGEETAANFTVNSEWANDASYIIDNIHPTGEGEDDTTFVTNILSLFSKDMNFGEYTGTFNGYIQFYTTSQLGTDISYNQTCLETSNDVTNSVLDDISEVSGVSLDEEGVDMTQWTKAYNAMSRVLTAMDEMLEKLINGTGLVGRS